MLKKLTSFLLSLLLCLSLLPGQARTADEPDPTPPPVIEEPLELEEPEDPGKSEPPEEPVMPMSEEVPQKEDTHL